MPLNLTQHFLSIIFGNLIATFAFIELSILHFVFFYENLKKISEHESKSEFFPIPIAYWSGFGIFKQNRDNPDEIGMVGQSGHKIFLY